jgi:alpha-1,2-mannosyltransferase
MTARRNEVLRQVAAVVALAAVTSAFTIVMSDRHGFFDLDVYYGTLSSWAHGGGEIYDYLKPGTPYGFTYPPFAALVMLPLAYISWTVAAVVAATVSVLATAVVLWWLVTPMARRQGWPRLYVFVLLACLAVAFEPLRETITFGQINMLLVLLVVTDLRWLVARDNRWAGVGVGLATAIKLTPGIFIIYLLVTRRWRMTITAAVTVVAATVLAAATAPRASREFWTRALWDTHRVGDLAYVSNQSLHGLLARLDPAHSSWLPWLAVSLIALGIWALRVRTLPTSAPAGTAPRVRAELTGLALTGVVGCLISPITWVHHLVWLLPALVTLVDGGFEAPPRGVRRRLLLGFAIVGYALLTSQLIWLWSDTPSGLELVFGYSAYLWATVALLLFLPRPPGPPGAPPADGGRRGARSARSNWRRSASGAS